MVFIKEDHTPPLHWKIGRIMELHPGTDGIVRVVSVKTVTESLRRSLGKICIVPIDESM